jgi:Bacterial PH domain
VGVAGGVRWKYRSGSLLGIGVVGVGLLDAMLVWSAQDGLRAGRTGTALVDLLWGAAITALVVEVFVRPRVETIDDGVVLVNPYRTAVVPWGALERVDAELSLELVTRGRRFTSWAATGSRNARPRRRRWTEDDPDLACERGGTSPTLAEVLRTKGLASITGAMQCKLFIEDAWQAWRTSPGHQRGEGAPAVRWHWRSFALLAVLVLAVAVGSAAI